MTRKTLRGGALVVQDCHDIRFIAYPWDRPRLAYLIARGGDIGEFSAIPRLVKPGDVAFDVGANAGIYSVLLSRLCGPSGRVWAFEPVPDTFWRLRETLALNRCENVSAVRSAVCDKSGAVRVNLFEPRFSEWNTLGSPSMLTPERRRVTPGGSIEVPCCTLDEFCTSQGVARINFLKVDVEGFELAVFQGAGRLIAENRVDHICFEISKDPLKGAGIESRMVFEALERHGYSAYRFDTSSGRFSGPVEDTLEVWTNFYASRRDLSEMPAVQGLDGAQGNHIAIAGR